MPRGNYICLIAPEVFLTYGIVVEVVVWWYFKMGGRLIV